MTRVEVSSGEMAPPVGVHAPAPPKRLPKRPTCKTCADRKCVGNCKF